jgi:preprotein translocase subunit SecE
VKYKQRQIIETIVVVVVVVVVVAAVAAGGEDRSIGIERNT